MNEFLSRRRGGAASLVLPLIAAMLAGCAPLNPELPPPLNLPRPAVNTDAQAPSQAARELGVERAPTPPQAPDTPLGPTVGVAAGPDPVVAAVNLQQVALPTFVQLVYAEVLKKSVNIHPSVLQRQDLVSFRSGEGQTASQIDAAMRQLLKAYGLSVLDVGGLVRVLPDNAAMGDLPVMRLGTPSPEAPLALRPVFHLITLQSVRQVDVVNWLRTMFGDRVTVGEDSTRNAVLLRGNPDNVRAAMEAIAMLDQPLMKGRASVAITPVNASPDELARRLFEVLTAEGYAVHPVGQPVVMGSTRNPIILLPVSAVNAIYVFATTDAVGQHVVNWARNLDRPSDRAIGRNFFTYPVKHKDAESLAITLDRMLGGSAAPAAPAAGTAPAAAPRTSSAVVVDKATNTLIFQGKSEDYAQIVSLLQTLDRPTRSALIEITVAELTLNNNQEVGIDLLSRHIKTGGGYEVSSNAGGSTAASFNLRVFNGLNVPKLAISALASDSRATILSSPRVMARNGEQAMIQVGREVPVLTQQQQATNTTGNANVINSVQYRSTGVILRIKPVIHSGDMIDIDLTQEVSDVDTLTTGQISSPSFVQRKLETKLTLRNGSTALLAGLISSNASQGKAGVPLLKDIPLLGNLFSKQTDTGRRTELVILITPYIANDSFEVEAITDAFRRSLGAWAERVGPAPAGNPPPAPPASGLPQ